MFNPEHTIKPMGTVSRLLERIPSGNADRLLEKLEKNGLTEKVKKDIPTLTAIGAIARKVRGHEAAKSFLEKLYFE